MKKRMGSFNRDTMVKAYMQFWARIDAVVMAVGNFLE
jgi:hypothetical protein